MRRDRAAWILALIVALGGAMRVRHALAIGGLYAPYIDSEEGYYEAGIAQLSCHSLAQIPDVTPSAFRAPIYPSFLALTEALFALPSPRHARLAQALLSTLTLASAGLLGWLLFSPLAGVSAAALLAFNVNDILEVSSLNVHGFYGAGLLALAAAFVLWLERRDLVRAGLLGLMTAATLLCRPAHFPFPLLFAAACLWRWKFPEGRWRALLPVAAASALFLTPMALRNGLQFGTYSPFDLKGSYVLARSTIGPYVTTTVEEALDAAETIEPGFKARGLEGRALHEDLIRLAVRRIAGAPWTYAGYCLQRLFSYWKGLWFYLALGAWALWRRRGDRPLEAMVLTVASLSGYALAGGTPEYRVSALPMLCVVAGAGLASLPFAGSSPAVSAAVKRRLRAGAAILPGAFAVIYAAMLVFLAFELSEHLRPGSKVIALSKSCPDGRALHVLKLAALQDGGRGYSSSLYAKAANDSLKYPVRAKAIRDPRDMAALRRSKEYRAARVRLTQLLKSRPGDVGLLLEGVELEAQAGERAVALASLARAEGLPTLSDDDRRRIVELYQAQKEYRRALVPLARLLERRPLDPELRLARADLEALAGDGAAALKSLAHVEGMKTLTDEHRGRVGTLYRRLKEYGRALAILKPLLEARPGDAGLWLERAELEAQSGARDGALASLARAEASKPDDDARHRAALLYRELKEPSRALAALTFLLERQPKNVEFWLERAELEAQMGGKADALKSLSRANAANPDADGELRRRLALNYQSLGEYGRAVSVLDGLIRKNPGEGTFYSDMGLCAYLSGDASAAISALETAIRLKPDFVPAYLTLGAIHRAKGRAAEALKVYDAGLARSGADAEPLRAALVDERRTLLAVEAR